MSISDIIQIIVILLFVANIVLAGITVFFERRNPSSTWAWLTVIFFVPVIGFIFYCIFGKEGKKEKMFKRKAEHDVNTYVGYLHSMEKYSTMIRAQKQAIEGRIDIIDAKHHDDLAYLHINSGNCITYDNEVKSYYEGNSKYEDLINDIRNAKEYVHMEYYILRNDGLGNKIEAMNSAQQAVRMEPNNVEYQQLVQRLQSGGTTYRQYSSTIPMGAGTGVCLSICLANLLCNMCIPRGICFRPF